MEVNFRRFWERCSLLIFERCLRSIERIVDPALRAGCLVELIPVVRRADRLRAPQLVRRALVVLDQISDPRIRVVALLAVAECDLDSSVSLVAQALMSGADVADAVQVLVKQRRPLCRPWSKS